MGVPVPLNHPVWKDFHGFPLINHPFWGTLNYGNPHLRNPMKSAALGNKNRHQILAMRHLGTRGQPWNAKVRNLPQLLWQLWPLPFSEDDVFEALNLSWTARKHKSIIESTSLSSSNGVSPIQITAAQTRSQLVDSLWFPCHENLKTHNKITTSSWQFGNPKW